MPRPIEYTVIFRPSVDVLVSCEKLLIDAKDMAAFLGITTDRVFQVIQSGRLPRPVRLGFNSSVRWSVLELLDWVQAGCPQLDEWLDIYGRSGWIRRR